MVFHRDTPFLRPAIASVLAQSLTDLELVLVDNGTGLAADALGDLGKDHRLRWVRLERNEGIAAGHNAGVVAARSEFVGLLDYDDVALPRRFELQVACLRTSPAVGLVSALSDAIDTQGRVLGREFAVLDPAAQRSYSQYAAPFFTPACTVRRDLLLALPYRDQFSFCADFDFVTRAVERVASTVVPEVLLQYRHHSDQTTVQRAGRIATERCAVRLLTARRRAGRPEGGDLFAFTDVQSHPAEVCGSFARRCREEGFSVLAAYHARRIVAEKPGASAAFVAVRDFFRTLRIAPATERVRATRMFLTGPVRALGLSAVGKNNDGRGAG